MMKISVIIAAAGVGKRMGGQKQFIELSGVPIAIRSCMVFGALDLVEEIILVTHPDNIGAAQKLVKEYKLEKVKKVIGGGEERQDSVYKGLQEVSKDCEYVMVHDGARPLVSGEIVANVVAELKSSEAVVVGVPVPDTIKEIKQDSVISKTLDRKYIWSAQTPQAFKFSLITKAYEKAKADGLKATDDSFLVERFGKKVKMIAGSYDNIKITTPNDLVIAESIIRRRAQ
jgi:2-C-methyl-D-erythritol 4-phosphate cytidylyltransferase